MAGTKRPILSFFSVVLLTLLATFTIGSEARAVTILSFAKWNIPMPRLHHVFSVLLMLTGSAVLAEESGLPLAADGASQFTIVRPADASPSQVYAAEELQRLAKEMTGAQLPIIADDQPLPTKAILLGVTRHTKTVLGEAPDLAKLGDDGFRIVTRPPHLLIIGSPVRGTLYGVYDMARKKGWGQIQPSTAKVQEGYQWYDVATWTPEADQYLWVGPGLFEKNGGQSAIEAVYVDRFELTRVE
jgi:hypothetical protein